MSSNNRSVLVTKLLNATLTSIKSVVPVESDVKKPNLIVKGLYLDFGVLIGITGDMSGKIVFGGATSTFASIGEGLYGMPLEGEMIQSFSGELGNMIAGGISTQLAQDETQILITTPTILEGNTKLSGYKQALELPVDFNQIGSLNTYLLLD